MAEVEVLHDELPDPLVGDQVEDAVGFVGHVFADAPVEVPVSFRLLVGDVGVAEFLGELGEFLVSFA